MNAPYGPYFDSQKFRSAIRCASFIHVRRTENRRAPVPSRKRCSIFALPDPNWWMATSGWLARPYGYSGTIGNVPEAAISGTVMLPMVSDIGSQRSSTLMEIVRSSVLPPAVTIRLVTR